MPMTNPLITIVLAAAALTTPFPRTQAPAQPPAAAAPKVEKLGPNLFRIGQVRVNTTTHEVSVAGTVNTVTVLEFAANAKGG